MREALDKICARVGTRRHHPGRRFGAPKIRCRRQQKKFAENNKSSTHHRMKSLPSVFFQGRDFLRGMVCTQPYPLKRHQDVHVQSQSSETSCSSTCRREKAVGWCFIPIKTVETKLGYFESPERRSSVSNPRFSGKSCSKSSTGTYQHGQNHEKN